MRPPAHAPQATRQSIVITDDHHMGLRRSPSSRTAGGRRDKRIQRRLGHAAGLSPTMRQIDSGRGCATLCARRLVKEDFRHVTRQYRQSPRRSTTVLTAAALGLVITIAVPRAQQPPPAAPPQGARRPAAPATPGRPAGAASPGAPAAPAARRRSRSCRSSRARSPPSRTPIYGENVTMMAIVDQTLFPDRVLGGPGQDEEHRQGRARPRAAPQRTDRTEHLRHGDRRGRQVRRQQRQGEGSPHRVLRPTRSRNSTGKPAIVATTVDQRGDERRGASPAAENDDRGGSLPEGDAEGRRRPTARSAAIIEKSDVEGRPGTGRGARRPPSTTTEVFFKPHAKADAIGWAQDARKAAEADRSRRPPPASGTK